MAREFTINSFQDVWNEQLPNPVRLPILYTLVGYPSSIRNRMEVYKVTVTKENSKSNNTSAK